MAQSSQTLKESDRRLVAAWAADCAERVLHLFEAASPGDHRPRTAIARARAFARGELNTATEIRKRFGGGSAARDAATPAAAAAARSAGQASAVCHMGAHALGAAAYAARAVGLSVPGGPDAIAAEVHWQSQHMSKEVRAALVTLPPIGEDRSGPLGPGLLATGQMLTIIQTLQSKISATTLADDKHDQVDLR
ncbi:putative immunity protein [Devosia sp. CAU 1758]